MVKKKVCLDEKEIENKIKNQGKKFDYHKAWEKLRNLKEARERVYLCRMEVK